MSGLALALDALEVRHPAARAGVAPALRQFSLALAPGEQVAVIGPSGAGKTTLLHAAACALPPAAGSLRLDGQAPWSLGGRALRQLRGRLFLAPQTPPLPPRQRVVTAVLAARLPAMGLGASLLSLLRPRGAPEAFAALQQFDLGDKLWERVDQLSGGERQRVGLARALLSPATLWLIDEPLSALDPARAALALRALTGAARARRHAARDAAPGRSGAGTFPAHPGPARRPAGVRPASRRGRPRAPGRAVRELRARALGRRAAAHAGRHGAGPAGAALLMSTASIDPHRDPAWRTRVFWLLAAAVLLAPALVAVEFKPWELFAPDNLKITLRFLGDFLPPATSAEFLAMVLRETWRTVAIATAAMVLALLLAVPLTLLSSAALSVSALSGRMHPLAQAARQAVRAVLVVLRSVPELVWALVFVRVVGLGPSAGVLAIALTYAGMLGKVYGEILDSGELHPARTLLRNGSGRLQAFLYALLPGNARELTSYTVYRWECAVRSSAVLGFVGAGGLGQQLDASMKMFNGGEVATILTAFVLLVALADALSAQLRKVIG